MQLSIQFFSDYESAHVQKRIFEYYFLIREHTTKVGSMNNPNMLFYLSDLDCVIVEVLHVELHSRDWKWDVMAGKKP